MNRLTIPALLKFAIGVLLIQGATVLLVLATLRVGPGDSRLLMVGLGLLIGLLGALWFSSIAGHCSEQVLAKASEKFSRDRERIRRQSEKEKTREIKESHRQLLKETRRLQSRSDVKLGLGLAALGAAGVLLMLTQFVTLGLLALSAGGGALAGYTVRARQSRRLSGPAKLPAVAAAGEETEAAPPERPALLLTSRPGSSERRHP